MYEIKFIFISISRPTTTVSQVNYHKTNKTVELFYINYFFCLLVFFLLLLNRWLVNGLIVDDQVEQNTGDVTENRLMWPAVARNDLNSIFTCQAMNTQLVEPRESTFVLDLHCKYLIVLYYYYYFI